MDKTAEHIIYDEKYKGISQEMWINISSISFNNNKFHKCPFNKLQKEFK